MVDVWLPFGRTEVCVRIPTRNYLGSIEPKEKPGVPDAKAEIERALNEPIKSRRISEIAKPESKVAILVDDVTRSGSGKFVILPILNELEQSGVKPENVAVIFACGTHRAVTREEGCELLGQEILDRVKVLSHDCRADDLVYLGTTQKHGTKVYLNRTFSEADVRILTGDVCLHYFAGYGGGGKSVVPGVAGEETIKQNHALLLSSNAKVGVLANNPVHEDIVEAARLGMVDFAVNVVMNGRNEIVKAFAGDLETVFAEGVKLVDEMYRISIDRKADIVVVSPGGHPADVNLYQAYKALDNASEAVKRGGMIILVAECPEGHGSNAYYDWMLKFSDLKAVEREIKRNFVLGGHKAYLLQKLLQSHQVILVSSMPDYYASSVFKLKTARAVNNALNDAFNVQGKNARVWAMPCGNFTLPEVRAEETSVLPEQSVLAESS